MSALAEPQTPLSEDSWELLSQGAEGKVTKPFRFGLLSCLPLTL